jgi:predicted RNA binding protein YcfA (HicA-like mRNA interferase family)
MKSYSSREVIAALNADGWYEFACTGDHHHFKHPEKKGKATVPHPKKSIPIGTLKSISVQTGIKFN